MLIKQLFMSLLAICVFIRKMSIPVFWPLSIVLFFFCVCMTLTCMSCLYILDINPLSVISFANMFFHFALWIFILLIVFIAVQKFLSLFRSHLFIYIFISFALETRSKKKLLQFMSGFSMFPSRNFLVWCVTFRSLIHVEFILVYGVRKCSNFIILHVVP